ncbi:xanthine dehydrogenase family protein molybdopterin-binding subunit [Roseomonas sp. BN140053]|uniref:xanthine dehydrogenase family protein molybdopterin-binding subunit n=1 Tax=Roseomonas sp. BN140053 TaxID=3391898 RepID=UPI0039EC240B
MGFTGRKEDVRLVQGAGRYTADWNLPDQLYAAFLRSPHPAARIASIDTSEAEAAPGVVAVLTGDTVASMGTVPAAMPFPGTDGAPLRTPSRPALARGRVRFVGEEVALVVAATRAQAMDALELIAVEYEDLPFAVGFDAALAPDAPLVHDEVPGNVVFEHQFGDAAATEAAIAGAAHVVRLTLESPRVAANPMEPRAVLAWFDAATETFEIRCPNQGGREMSHGLGVQLGVPQEKVRVNMVDVGGAFGPRGSAYPEYAVLLFAARQLGRPVKWVSTRSEDFLTDSHGRGIRLEGELALDAEGNFLALRSSWLCDEGAYLTAAGALTNTSNNLMIAAGPYKTPVMHSRNRLVLTNANPTAPYRGAGRPDAVYLIERLVDTAAAELGMDPIALRRRNALPAEAMPHRSPSGSVFDSGNFPRLLDTAEREGDWAGFPARRAAGAAAGKLRGIGCALFLEPSGGGAAPKDQAALRFTPDGKATLFIVSTSNGQGHETVFAELVAGWLGLDRADVTLRGSDPDGPALIGSGSFGSRSLMTQGSVLKHGSDLVIEKGRALAADLLEAAPADLEFADGAYTVAGTDRRVSMTQVIAAGALPEGGHALDTEAELTIPRAFPSGAHVAEVEIEPDTGVLEVVRYVAVDDAGKIYNHVLAAGQLQGGLVQGAGQVFGEHCHYDPDSGQLLAASFMDYLMPRADSFPGAKLHDASTPSPTNPLGAKGVGESGTIGAAPALMNAVVDALRPAGIAEFDMPATPARLWAALHAAGRA